MCKIKHAIIDPHCRQPEILYKSHYQPAINNPLKLLCVRHSIVSVRRHFVCLALKILPVCSVGGTNREVNEEESVGRNCMANSLAAREGEMKEMST